MKKISGNSLIVLLADLEEFKKNRRLTEQEKSGFELCQAFISGVAKAQIDDKDQGCRFCGKNSRDCDSP